MISFTGKTVLVTGGGAGIGRACAEAFGAAGARRGSRDRPGPRARRAPGARSGGRRCARRHRGRHASRRGRSIRARRRRTLRRPRRARQQCGRFPADRETVRRLHRRRHRAAVRREPAPVFIVTRAMLPLLRKRGAGSSIVGVSSIEGFRAIPNCTVYASFKAALTGFTKSLALELGPAGIRVKVAPETTETPQVPSARWSRPSITGTSRAGSRSGASARPAISRAPRCSSRPLAAWVTGTTLHVDGGALAAAGWYRDPNGFWTNLPVVTGTASISERHRSPVHSRGEMAPLSGHHEDPDRRRHRPHRRPCRAAPARAGQAPSRSPRASRPHPAARSRGSTCCCATTWPATSRATTSHRSTRWCSRPATTSATCRPAPTKPRTGNARTSTRCRASSRWRARQA